MSSKYYSFFKVSALIASKFEVFLSSSNTKVQQSQHSCFQDGNMSQTTRPCLSKARQRQLLTTCVFVMTLLLGLSCVEKTNGFVVAVTISDSVSSAKNIRSKQTHGATTKRVHASTSKNLLLHVESTESNENNIDKDDERRQRQEPHQEKTDDYHRCNSNTRLQQDYSHEYFASSLSLSTFIQKQKRREHTNLFSTKIKKIKTTMIKMKENPTPTLKTTRTMPVAFITQIIITTITLLSSIFLVSLSMLIPSPIKHHNQHSYHHRQRQRQ